MPRCYGHDYHSRCIYHITLKKNRGVSSFSHLCDNWPTVEIIRSRLGVIIEKHIRLIPSLDPALRLLQYCIMPDHIHLLLFVTAPTKLHLGNYIGKLKIAIHQEYHAINPLEISIFEEDFYDCILHSHRSLDTLYKYIRDNPRRLAVRRAHPEFFRRVNALKIGDQTCQAYGNFQLLECPFKEQVVVHRADSAETLQRNRERWLYTAANGGVLVSPFISAAEKAVRTEADEAGGRFILIINEPIGERYKPSGRDFELCEAGRLLIISANAPGALSRAACLAMNELAKNICFSVSTACR